MDQFPENISALGADITAGDVLVRHGGTDRGVVMFVGDPSTVMPGIPATGRIGMVLREPSAPPGMHRVTNDFAAWEHVPPERQTHLERLWSWLYTKEHDICAEGGVLAMLPPATADALCDRGVELTLLLQAMALHLDEMRETIRALRTPSKN